MDDLRIQYNEFMVGANDPDHEDTINRAFNVQHNPDGTHPDSLLGYQGAQGESGPQGVQGNQGTEGSQGSQGPQGNQGSQGDIGQQGFQGSQGETGAQGPQGNQGNQGYQGDQGTEGFQGSQGDSGAQGPQGAAGAQGSQGDNGAQGFQGSQGSQGVQGGDGLGVSWQGAYDGDTVYGQGAGVSFSDELYISLVSGNQGHQPDISSSQWELFAGAQGPQGAQGSTGAQGPQGNIGSQGVAGPQGTQGRQGVVGATGAQGPQGNVGVQGATGPQGTQGRQGVVGATGAQGPQGNVGAQGTQGRQGYQGKQGSTGAQGLVGPQGYSGSQGPSGPQGTTGPQGAAGPSLRDITKNLKINYVGGTTDAASITASGAILSTSANITKAYLNINITSVKLSTSGANGLDTGTVAAGTWYNLWLIGKTDGTIAGLWSLSATSPTMPSGYTYKAWIGAANSTNTINFWQMGNIVLAKISSMGLNIAYTSLYQMSISTKIPAQAVAIRGILYMTRTTEAGQAEVYLSGASTLQAHQQFKIGTADALYATTLTLPFYFPLITAQTLYAEKDNANTQASMDLTGWDYP